MHLKSGMVVHIINSTIREAEAGESLRFEASQGDIVIPCLQELHKFDASEEAQPLLGVSFLSKGSMLSPDELGLITFY